MLLIIFHNDGSIIFLLVGTIEPRKGYLQVFDAFSKLWEKNIKEMNFIKKNKTNERFIFFEKPDDCKLDLIYKKSNILISSSYGEGFGLPLLEALSKGITIVARDIPVFREISNDIIFFKANTSDDLFYFLKGSVISSYKFNKVKELKKINYITWNDASVYFLKILSKLIHE
jgi:glycosyltransferase involved in cell wall biosynthesis